MSAVRIALTRNPDATAAARELAGGLRPSGPRLALYLASSAQDPAGIAAAMEQAVAPATVIGCSTAGEIVSGSMLERSVVAMALGAEVVRDVGVEVVTGLRAAPGNPVAGAFQALGNRLGMPMRDLHPSRDVGLVLIDGMSGAEERLIDAMGSGTDELFVGGSAGDDLAF